MTSPNAKDTDLGGPETPSMDGETIQKIRGKVETLCSEYSTADPAELKLQAEAELEALERLLASRDSPDDQGALLEQAGWLTLLLAALAFDLGNAEEAEQARQRALAIGTDLEHSSILGWAHETAVWIEIANSNWANAYEKAAVGLAASGHNEPTGVAIQLALQQAEASARSDDPVGTSQALDAARRLLQSHPEPSNPKNHFAFDHAKFDLRQMRILLIIGDDEKAERVALRLQQQLRNPDGTSRHPMRSSEVLASLGLVAARRGQIDQAIGLLREAITIGRRSRLSFQQITSGVADELAKHADIPSVEALLNERAALFDSDGEDC